MNTTTIKRLTLLLLILVVIVGLILGYSDLNNSDSAKQCRIDLGQECVLFNNNQEVSVQFLQAIEVEEELKLQISIPKHFKIVNMWVQGVNMFMGKHSIFIDAVSLQQDQSVYSAHLFLGSCSEPKMKWQLIIQTQNAQKIEESWFFNFNTDRNNND